MARIYAGDTTAMDIEDIGVWEWLWSVVEKLGIVYGIVIVVCLIYNLLPQQNKKIINL